MKINKNIIITLLISVVVLIGCTGSQQFVAEKPQTGKSLVVGGVLLENNGLEGKYETIFSKITLVVVGKSIEDGEEVTKGYRVKTDENGYFVLQNVPAGAYVIKGFEADVGFETRLFVTSRWDGNRQSFYYSGAPIDHTVRVWPEMSTEKIIDLQITYFMVDQAMRVANDNFKLLLNKPGIIPGSNYTMKNPVKYYSEKYPTWEWFQL